jgi:hypothetical protein
MAHQNWNHVESDFKTPKVGDSWFSTSSYGQIIEYTVLRVTKTLIVLLQQESGGETRVSRETLKSSNHFHSNWDFYPLTEERIKILAAKRREDEVYVELIDLLRKAEVSCMSPEQREALLKALKAIL